MIEGFCMNLWKYFDPGNAYVKQYVDLYINMAS